MKPRSKNYKQQTCNYIVQCDKTIIVAQPGLTYVFLPSYHKITTMTTQKFLLWEKEKQYEDRFPTPEICRPYKTKIHYGYHMCWLNDTVLYLLTCHIQYELRIRYT